VVHVRGEGLEWNGLARASVERDKIVSTARPCQRDGDNAGSPSSVSPGYAGLPWSWRIRPDHLESSDIASDYPA
jgi:hypothetical protein